jgi:hypothetical protein
MKVRFTCVTLDSHAAFHGRLSAEALQLGRYLLFASRYLEKKGAAVRFPTRFREYALERKQEETRTLIKLLSRCHLLRHLPAQSIEDLLPTVRTRRLAAGEVLFRAGDPGDALFIVAKGRVQVQAEAGTSIAELNAGEAFGEMALLSGGARTATAVPLVDVEF